MKIEFPIRHIENNLVFNRNGDVWSYYKYDEVEQSFFQDVNGSDMHLIVFSNAKRSSYYKGVLLKENTSNKIALSTNVKCFLEGLKAQINRSVGLTPYSLLKEDIKEYTEQVNVIEAELKDKSDLKKINKATTQELIRSINNTLNIHAINKNNDFLQLNDIRIEPYDEKTLHLTSGMESENTDLFVQYFVVNKTVKIDDISWFSNLDFPLHTSIRTDFKYKNPYSIIVRIEGSTFAELQERINQFIKLTTLFKMKVYSPFGEQFTLLYSSLIGTNMVDNDYHCIVKEK